MAFFEELGKKLSDAGQNVAQQTKNLADVAQLNSAINEAERKITQLKTKLGQSYYEAHKNDASAEGADIIAQITALYADIQTTRDKINDIKGIVKCTKCGADVPVGSAFCGSCGTKVEAPAASAAPSGNICPKCGTVVAEGKAFCNNCGTKIEKPATAEETKEEA